MAHIVVITHHYDDFLGEDYLLRHFLERWSQSGHAATLQRGLGDWPEGDIAILHVDLSVVPTAYAEASRKYPVVVNGAALNICKKVVSRHLVKQGDGWLGPVIVKTDLNCSGMRELRLQQRMQRDGIPTAGIFTGMAYMPNEYPIYASPAQVHKDDWENPGLVVEQYLPEQDSRGFWTRVWVFFGDRERCTRYLGNGPIVKSGNIVDREPSEVPQELRAERARLGFDYGKFDFVIHDGKVVLLDANRTPWAPPSSPEMETSNAKLAEGLDSLLGKK